MSIVLSTLCGVACTTTPTLRNEPLRIAFGDCAAADVSWVSGPRPLPFTAQEVERGRTRPTTACDRPPYTTSDPPYQPGEHNPLRAVRDELEACLRTASSSYGAVVVQLETSSDGAVVDATPYGLENLETITCVVNAAKHAHARGGARSRRCSLAFGDMPLEALPAIAVTPDSITLDGVPVATQLAYGELGDDAPTLAIVQLRDALRAGAERAYAPDAPVVAIRGPAVISAAGTAPMRVITKTAVSVTAAGDDYVLAIGQTGEPLQRHAVGMELPAVPVPYGTGGSWLSSASLALGCSERAQR